MSTFHGVIYIITNTVNGEQYVGQTTSIYPERYIEGHFRSAKNGGDKILYSAIRKYGREVFTSEIIWWCKDKVSLDISENSFIRLFETMTPFGYNLKGGGSRGKFSDELKAKHSVILKAALNAPGMHEKLSLAITEALSPIEVRDKLRVGSRVSWEDPVVRRKRLDGMEASRQKQKDKLSGTRWITDGVQDKRIKKEDQLPTGWQYGRSKYVTNNTAESSERRRLAALEVGSRPEIKMQRSANSKLLNARPGMKERKSETSKRVLSTPEYKEKRALLEADPDLQRRRGISQKVRFSDPDYLADWSSKMTAVMNNPAVAARHKAAYDNPITKQKQIDANIGLKCINNGIRNTKLKPGDPLPDGWVFGMLYPSEIRKSALAKGRHVRFHVNRNIVNPACPFCTSPHPEEP